MSEVDRLGPRLSPIQIAMSTGSAGVPFFLFAHTMSLCLDKREPPESSAWPERLRVAGIGGAGGRR